MQLGKIGKGLTAALVGGALLWPASSAEKPYENIHNYSRPAMAYAAETAAKPATRILNETGRQYNYKTTMPVKVHYEKLPAGIDPKAVKVFDDKDLYHYVEDYQDWSGQNDSLIPKESWICGDVSDVMRSKWPDMMSIEELNGKTLVPGKEYRVFITGWKEDVLTTGRREGDKIYINSTRLGGSGTQLHQELGRNFVKITRTDSGRVMNTILTTAARGVSRGEFNNNIWQGSKPYAGYENCIELSYIVPGTSFFKNLSQYSCGDCEVYWVFNPTGFPPGDYTATINTSKINAPQVNKTVEFKIENPNKPDPRIAMALGMDYDFLANGDAIPWYMINPNSLHAYKDTPSGKERKTFDLSGVVKFDMEGSLPDKVDRMGLKVYVTKPGWMYTDDTQLLETTLTKNSDKFTMDTTRLPNGKYTLHLCFDGTIPKDSTTGWVRRDINIQNQPLVASQPKE